MDANLLKILSEELRETRIMVVETRNLVVETRRMADAAQRTADAAQTTASAAWEQVIMTRNQIQEDMLLLRRPWWRKLIERFA